MAIIPGIVGMCDNQELCWVLNSAETIIRLFDYSVGMTLFDSLTHYSNNR